MRFSHLFHTPEPAFPTLPRDYGGVRCSTIPKNGRKNGIVRHLRDTERAKAAGGMRPWQEKRVQDSIPFIYLTFRPSPIRNKNQESRKRQHSDRNNSHPDMRRGTSQKPPHTNRKTSKATSQIYDVARLKNTSKHPFLLSRRNQQRLKHNEPTHRLLLGVAPKASTTIKFRI